MVSFTFIINNSTSMEITDDGESLSDCFFVDGEEYEYDEEADWGDDEEEYDDEEEEEAEAA